MTEYMREESEPEQEPGYLRPLSPKGHYEQAMAKMTQSADYGVDSPHRTNLALEAIAHAFLGGLAGELEYRARNPYPEGPPSGYPDPQIEEIDDRP